MSANYPMPSKPWAMGWNAKAPTIAGDPCPMGSMGSFSSTQSEAPSNGGCAGNVYMVNMDQYSDASDSQEDDEQQPSPKNGGEKGTARHPPLLGESSPPSQQGASTPSSAAATGPSSEPVDLPPAPALLQTETASSASATLAPWRKDNAWSGGRATATLSAAPWRQSEADASEASGERPSPSARWRKDCADGSGGETCFLPPWRQSTPAQGLQAVASSSLPRPLPKELPPAVLDAETQESGCASPETVETKAEAEEKTTVEETEKAVAGETEEDRPTKDQDEPLGAIFDVRQLLLWRRVALQEAEAEETGGRGRDSDGARSSMPVYVVVEAQEVADAEPEKREDPEGTERSQSVEEKQAKEAPASPVEASASWRSRGGERSPQSHSAMREGRRGLEKLEVSENSWAAQQRARRQRADTDDTQVERAIKSILNKLTVEKFTSLYYQLIECGIEATEHVELLIQEVFEKATTQHHFIDMYADLCTLLQEHFALHPIGDPKFSFKRLLQNACQASFERHLTPPSLDDKEIIMQVNYKTRMLGTIRFVGALLARKMLASKVLIAIVEELLSDPTPEALESLAALLTVVGPTFDKPDWAFRSVLNHYFEQVQAIVKKPSVEPRARCLLKDVLELRAAEWHSSRPQRQEKPQTLEEVKEQAAAEEQGIPPTPPEAARKKLTLLHRSSGDTWEKKPAATPSQKAAALSQKSPTPGSPQKQPTSPPRAAMPSRASAFDRSAFREEVGKILAELRYSQEPQEAMRRLAQHALPVPAGDQPNEFCALLARIAEEGSAEVRIAGFAAAVALFTKGHWHQTAAKAGLHLFMEACEDLRCDVPALPRILRDELDSALGPLADLSMIDSHQREALIA